MKLHCPKEAHMVDCLVCIYRCTPYYKRKCTEYEQFYDQIKALPIDSKYVEKYGEPDYPEPYGVVRKRRAENAKAKAAARKEKEAAKKCKKATKPRKKAVVDPVKPKRRAKAKQ